MPEQRARQDRGGTGAPFAGERSQLDEFPLASGVVLATRKTERERVRLPPHLLRGRPRCGAEGAVREHPHRLRNPLPPGGLELSVGVEPVLGDLLRRPISFLGGKDQISGVPLFLIGLRPHRMREKAVFCPQRVVVVLAALAAELDRQKQLSFACLELAFEGKLALPSGFQRRVERPALGHELVQLEGHGPGATIGEERAPADQDVAHVPGTVLRLEPRDLGKLSGHIRKGPGRAALQRSIGFLLQAQFVFQPAHERVSPERGQIGWRCRL